MATPELRHMLRDDDLNHEEQKQVLELAIKFHKNRFYHQPFAGPQGIAVLFDKPSTRTRSSFSIGIAEMFTTSRALVASQRNMAPFALAALIYWVTCLLIEFALRRAEKGLDYYHD